MKKTSGASLHTSALDRRRFLGAALGACTNIHLVSLVGMQLRQHEWARSQKSSGTE